MGLVDSCDMRVFTETVALEDMEEDVDEDAFAFDCRCSGRFILPWEGVVSARAEGRAEERTTAGLFDLLKQLRRAGAAASAFGGPHAACGGHGAVVA